MVFAALFLMGMAFSAQAQSINVKNPGFETGLLTPWVGSPLVSISSINQHSGSYCVTVSSTSSGHGTCLQTVTGLKPNTTYELTGFAQIGTATAGSISIGSYGGATKTTFLSTSISTYQQINIVFTTGATNTSATILVGNNGLSGMIYADDFFIGYLPATDQANAGNWKPNRTFTDEFDGTALDTTKWQPYSYWSGRAPSQYDPNNVVVNSGNDGLLHLLTINENLLVNGNFESSATVITGWTDPDGAAAITTATADLSGEDNGTPFAWLTKNAVKITGTDTNLSNVLQQTISVTPNTTYRLSGNLKVGAAGTTATLGVISPAVSTTRTATTWAPQTPYPTVTFTTGPSQTTATVYIENSGTVGGIVYADEISVVPTVLPDGFAYSGGNVSGDYYTAANIQSVAAPHYGYYETRMKSANATSSSAFWFRAEAGGGLPAMEIDVAETVGNSIYYPTQDKQMRINTFYGNFVNPDVSPVGDLGVRVADAFHIYAMDWEADKITFYFDGNPVAVRTINQQVTPPPSANGQTLVTQLNHLFFDTEIFSRYGLPPDDSMSDYQVDYIRAWTH